MRRRLNVLITNIQMHQRTGTETAVRDLALGLQAWGHQPMVYSPTRGDLLDELAVAGIPTFTELTNVPQPPDIIHGHHHLETVAACTQFPNTCAIFVVHSNVAYFDIPPLLDQIRCYVAVDYNCVERLLELKIPRDRIRIIYNAIDLRRFAQRQHQANTPTRALIFSNQANAGTQLGAIEAACAQKNIALDVVGLGVGRVVQPEAILPDYDLVFAKARAAMEAMASGAAVILCDYMGLGEMVTSTNVAEFQRWNFGMRLLTQIPEPAKIIREIERYQADDAQAVSDYIRASVPLDRAVQDYVAIYQAVLEEKIESAPTTVYPPIYHNLEYFLQQKQALDNQIRELQTPKMMGVRLDIPSDSLQLEITHSPQVVTINSYFSVQVTLQNHSPAILNSYPPFPLCLSYRWLAANGELYIPEGFRTKLPRPLHPHQRMDLSMLTRAPQIVGDYWLRVTLVQEKMRWYDDPPHPLYVDLPMTVE